MDRKEPSTALQFTEQMKGYVGRGQTNFERGYEAGKVARDSLMFELTIRTEDVDRFCADAIHQATATGFVQSGVFGGRRQVESGTFNLFTAGEGDASRRKMLYRLFFSDSSGNPLTLSGFKDVQDDAGPDIWKDTTTLYTYVLRGHVAPGDEPLADIVAAGILRIELTDFLKQLTTFRTYGSSYGARINALRQFGQLFLGGLWETYGLASIVPPHRHAFEREIPLYTTEGVRDAAITTHPFSTADKLGLAVTRFRRDSCDDVVVIIHGLTTSTDMFIMPEHYNLVTFLLDQGYTDVWTVDFRMSNRFSYNLLRHRYTMDDIALYDFPAAFAEIRRHVGDAANIHVICHCLGSVSFMMSLFGRAVSGIRSVVANSVALTPCIPGWSKAKLAIAPFALEYLLGVAYVNPQWSHESGITAGKIFSRVNSFFHRECDVPACHMLSIMWGSGRPALYNHRNLADVTHQRGGDLYGPTSVHYHRHVRKMVRSNNTAVKYDVANPKHRALPDNYLQYAAEIQTPVLFVTGGENRVFTDSNILCHERLERVAPGRHALKVFAGYGHQDVFMGKDCDRDIFPALVEFIRQHSRTARTVSVPALASRA